MKKNQQVLRLSSVMSQGQAAILGVNETRADLDRPNLTMLNVFHARRRIQGDKQGSISLQRQHLHKESEGAQMADKSQDEIRPEAAASQRTDERRKGLLPPLFSPEQQPMLPSTVSAAEMRPGILITLFHCQAPGCEQTMKIELIAAGTPHEDDQYQAFRAGASKPASIICDYLSRYTQSWHPSDVEYARLELALRQGDAAALAALDKSYAPFYCQHCNGCYCYQHMRFTEVWDDYYPHPDYWYGTCPYGHGVFVNH